ncbi:DUF4139 domain-containing protein [Aliiroseovarius crassostreae]|uniref:DUF4139 domain-containing protein n=1 Tax=Aliiroseovarius crassostreae TaxID=154981 RepID=UPI003C7C113C
MRRALLLSALTTLPLPLWAEDFHTSAPVVAAILYPQGATQTHHITVDLPAGQHRILVAATPFHETDGVPDLMLVEGQATLGAVTFIENSPLSDPALLTPAQAAAKDVLDTAKDALTAQKDVMSGLTDSIAALNNELAFLESISAPNDATSVDDLKAMAALVGRESEDVRSRIAEKQLELRDAKDLLTERKTDRDLAQIAFDRLSPPPEIGRVAALSVSLAEAQKLVIATRSDHWGGGWVPQYDLHLAEPAQDSLTINRNVNVTPPLGAVWDQIDLTLSTQRPSDRVDPSAPQVNRASIHAPRPVPSAAPRSLKSADMAEVLESAVVEPELMMDGAAGMVVDTGGVAVSYRYPTKVSAAGGDTQILELGNLTLPVTPEIYAVPRRDTTAFLVAQMTNDTEEPLLGGAAKMYRGDTLMGRFALPFLAAGDDTTLPFGPIEGIRLEHVVATNETGDRGLISTTNTREQDTAFRVTNLTSEAQEVRAFYPLTYSEQEDLEVEITATPRPDETDHDDKRGLSVWNLSLAPGEETEVTINTRLSWPEGWELNWRP